METHHNNLDIKYHVLRASINAYGKTPHELEPEQLDKVRSQAARECELEQLVLNSIEAQDVHIPGTVLHDAIKQVENHYTDRETYLQDLENNGLNITGFQQAISRELKVNAVLDRISSRSARVSELDCMLYYYMHKAKFSQPETRTTRHILVTVNEDYAENTYPAVIDKIAAIRRRLSAKPGRFSEQAMKHSECPSALQGGLLGNIPRGQLYPELDNALFNMCEGEISEAIESEVGLHILYCEKIHQAGPVPFKQAESRIREMLTKRRTRMCQKSWLSSLRENTRQGDDVYE